MQLALQSWSKVCGTPFHHRPLFDDESGSFSQIGPPPSPIQCCFKGDNLSALSQYCIKGGGGGEGGGERVKKGLVYHES